MGNSECCYPGEKFHKPSFRCTYDVPDTNEVQIINDRGMFGYNSQIKSKIKILNNNNLKEDLVLKKKFNNIGINTIDFIIDENLTDMIYMFYDCKSLIKVEFFYIDTSRVTNMAYMFYGCNKLQSIIRLNLFNTSNINSMRGMFQGCNDLEYLDLSNFDISNVRDMEYMFKGCSKLKEIKGIDKFNYSKNPNTNKMFDGCDALNGNQINSNNNILKI